jgi:hypothetical protein
METLSIVFPITVVYAFFIKKKSLINKKSTNKKETNSKTYTIT